MSKHTPGPWRVETEETVSVRDRKDGSVATLGWLSNRMAGPRRSSQEVQANARLIAAAPELLEALKLATNELNIIRARDGAPQHIDWHRGRPLQTSSCTEEWWNELTEKCFAAIAKAEGRE